MSKRNKKSVVIGTGLGGLLTGAFLARHGWQVTYLEALDFIGGRFTHLDFEGFAVPTGAFHTLPGGRRGPIYRCLQILGVDVELIECSPSFLAIIDGHTYPLEISGGNGKGSGARQAAGIHCRARLFSRMSAALAKGVVGLDTSVADMLRGLSHEDRALRLFDHLTKFSAGVAVESASALEILRSLRAQRFGKECFLALGNRELVHAIMDRARASGATLRTRSVVRGIAVENGCATGVITGDDEFVEADLVVSNAGAQRTERMLGENASDELSRRVLGAVSAWGAAHALRCNRRLACTQQHRDNG